MKVNILRFEWKIKLDLVKNQITMKQTITKLAAETVIIANKIQTPKTTEKFIIM